MKKKVDMKKMMKSLTYVIAVILIVVLVPYYGKVESDPVEELALPAGVGYDIEQKIPGEAIYNVTLDIYSFGDSKSFSVPYKGSATTLGETRQERNTTLERKLVFGLERVDIISEGMAEFGINNIIDILTTNPMINDRCWVIVCEGKAEDMVKLKIEGYQSVMDYLEKLIDNSVHSNFFGNDYKIIDLYVRNKSEGKNVVLPYIEVKEKKPKISGLAIFKHGKMLTKTDMEDTKRLNMLRENESQGILTLQKSPTEYIDIRAKVKRKVKCTRENGEYKFTINLKVEGEVASNEMYKNLSKDVEQKKKLEKDMAKHIEEISKEFIDKMKNQYKVDCLELGLVGCATYGRKTGVDWDDIVADSKIDVKVDVKVNRYGRGDY